VVSTHLIHHRFRELLDLLSDVNRLEIAAHDAGPTETAWESLEVVYRDKPKIEAELDWLESEARLAASRVV
jgi:hypothetical protein